jgi:hypothetical protein
MGNFFSYESKIEIPAYKIPPEVVEKFIQNLQRWLSNASGEDSTRDKGNISFAINPAVRNLKFSGIGSGEISISIQQEWLLIVEYRLSYLFPFLANLIINLFFFGLPYFNLKTEFSIQLFQTLMRLALLVNIVSIFLTIRDFPNEIMEIWHETKNSFHSPKS